MADITVTVGGTPAIPTYSGAPSAKVGSDGKVTVSPGTTTIQFKKATTAAWTFKTKAITFDDAGPFTISSHDASQVTISDNDPAGTDQTYEYTLKTSAGDFDPQILNKGRG